MKTKIAIIFIVATALVSCSKKSKVNTGLQVNTEAQASQEGFNPFFEQWNTPFGTPPFDQIKNSHYVPAIERGLAEHREEIKKISENTEPPTFENTIVALDQSGESLRRTTPVFYALTGANTNDELQELERKIKPMMSKHRDDIMLNQKLFERVKAVYDNMKTSPLEAEQKKVVEEYYKDFVQSGAALDKEGKKKLRAINDEYAMLTLGFSENVLKENKKFVMVLDKPEDLDGLPESVVTAAKEVAALLGHEGKWAFTLDRPSFTPFLEYSKRRDLRKTILKAYADRGDNNDEVDNKKIVKKIVDLRIEKAKLLGSKTWADFALDRSMAKTPDNVYKLIDKVWKSALPVAKKEAKDLQKMIKKDGDTFKLEPWDWRYYSEKLRKEKYDLNGEELRPYFPIDKVRDGAFEVANKLYGIQFVERTDIPKYHPDVKTFEVKEEDGTHIGIFYVDYFPRQGKRGGAWSGGFRDQRKVNGQNITPLVTNVCNFSMPTEGKPALLSLDEVETLFHEFGHALQSLLSNVTYERLSESIYTDFVELPSQIMENWATDPVVLKMYAKHYQTGETIPDELIAKIEKSKYFNQGFVTVEYMSAAFLDMAWHLLDKPVDEDVDAFETAALKKIDMIPEIIVRYRSTNFNHIFSGDGYSAGYYSYMWSEVLDADAFEVFKEKGLFDKETAKLFRENILSKGGSEDPMVLYKQFSGREPDVKPLLKRKGMLK